MNQDRDITAEVREILQLATPNEPDPIPDATGPTAREIRIRLKLVLYTAIAVISMAVFFWNAVKISANISIRKSKPVPAVTPAELVEPSPTFQKVSYTDQTTQPIGKITSPVAHAATDRTVTVTGFTENIPIDTPLIWLMVDVPSISRTWPKRPVIQPNGTFLATIHEGGPNTDFTVSLYAVGYGLNKIIEQWIADNTFGGLPMMPPQYRLDSVSLSLNGV